MRRAKIKVRKARTLDGSSYYYTVVGANGEPLATSEMYTSKASAKRGAKALKRAVLFAKIEDSA